MEFSENHKGGINLPKRQYLHATISTTTSATTTTFTATATTTKISEASTTKAEDIEINI